MKQLAIVDMATLHIKAIVVSVRNVNKGKKDMKANELMIGDWVNHKGIYNYIASADFDYNHRKWIEEIEPILDDNGNYITSTKINPDEVYVRLRTKAGEIRFGYFDFSQYIREQIQNIFINDFGDYAYECLYVDYEDTEDLERTLNEQKLLITEKYGKCVSKKENRITKKFKL